MEPKSILKLVKGESPVVVVERVSNGNLIEFFEDLKISFSKLTTVEILNDHSFYIPSLDTKYWVEFEEEEDQLIGKKFINKNFDMVHVLVITDEKLMNLEDKLLCCHYVGLLTSIYVDGTSYTKSWQMPKDHFKNELKSGRYNEI